MIIQHDYSFWGIYGGTIKRTININMELIPLLESSSSSVREGRSIFSAQLVKTIPHEFTDTSPGH